MLVYKLLLPDEWTRFEESGRFEGSPFDASSGFIHLSSGAQVAATAVRVFPHEPELVVVALDEQRIGDVRWEPAPDGGTFPHAYAALTADAVRAVHRVPGAGAVGAAVSGG